ncbi:MAG: twin-arginine translocase TatA/TatE family subunit [Chloroflexi bacterium]|nr:twin-arginine translocase TatA/TatE family subunit [Chloroflexota bacterium]
MFKSFGLPELLIILVIVLLIFGAGKLPQIGGAIGKSIKEFRKEKDTGPEKTPEKTTVQASQTEKKEAKS